MKILCVAEKNMIAKGVANILGRGNVQTRQTDNKYIKNYCFSTEFQGQQNNQVVMTSVSGHLCSLDFPPDFKRWENYDPSVCFDAPVVKSVSKDMETIKKNLQEQSRGSQYLIIWTDCDLEGENIGNEIVEVCKMANPRLTVKRAKFSVIQDREIQQAWRTLGNMDMLKVAAVEARQELDLRIGAAFTRFQTLQLRQEFNQLDGMIISYGSCQFPTLGFIVDQFEKCLRFKEEIFWKIQVVLKKLDQSCSFAWCRRPLFNHRLATSIYEACVDNPIATVTNVTRKPKEKWKPLPLTTIEMMKFCTSRLRMSAHKVMEAAENLYRKQWISYPRTETDIFLDSFDFNELIQAQTRNPVWGGFANNLSNGGFKKPRAGKNNDEAHPPIHPTVGGNGDMVGDEKRLYEFITRRFLACCSENAKGFITTVDIRIDDEKFQATGEEVAERNYLEVYIYESWSDKSIPNFVAGEAMMPESLLLRQGKTTRPSCLNERQLIEKMEESSIGTDATIHEHIKKIQEREYVNKDGDKFMPTPLGMGLVLGYRNMEMRVSLSKPYLRSQLEVNIKRIFEGARTKEDVLAEDILHYKNAYREANTGIRTLKQTLLDQFNTVN
ncbi:UNVERIFIED_CONTAM: DNA topoisomerase [Siphonaria sp. JEL0065]|nr:DNA topoisomerase [Siphonaria sp. JEL0065]